MKKYDVLGCEMVRLDDVCYAVRKTKKAIEAAYGHRSADEKEGMRKACESIISCIFAEEIYQAKSQDEINAILEVRGDFIVMKSEEGKRMYFSLWKEKEAVITDDVRESMHFLYEGMAQHIAERLGDGWIVLDTCPAAYEDVRRLLAAIFREEDEDEE